jgi:hypothetical protein
MRISRSLNSQCGFSWPMAAIIAFCLAAPIRGQEAAPESLPEAAKVLERFIEATGGTEAYTALTSIYSSGTYEISGKRLRGRYTTFEAPPDRTRTILEYENGKKYEEGTIDGLAWEMSEDANPRIKAGVEKAFALREASFNSVLLWKKLYTKVETIGIEKIAGMTCYKVKLSPASGHPIVDYFDKVTGLRVKSETMVSTPAGDIPSENLYNDYRSVGGVKFPFRMMHSVADEAGVIALEKIECNVEIGWYRFDPPREVKALLVKGKN